MKKIALVVGATGITGSNLAEELIAQGFTTYGLSRNPNDEIVGLIPVKADLLDVENLTNALEQIAPTHVYFTTWMRNDTEAENIRVNSLMVRNLLDVLSPKKSIQHVALVTGLKHYLGPFDAYANSGTLPETPVREEHPRLSFPNFYYAQEDEVYAAADREGFSWSIHRPHTVIGYAVGNQMNMGTTLAVYAAIWNPGAKYSGRMKCACNEISTPKSRKLSHIGAVMYEPMPVKRCNRLTQCSPLAGRTPICCRLP